MMGMSELLKALINVEMVDKMAGSKRKRKITDPELYIIFQLTYSKHGFVREPLCLHGLDKSL